VKDRVSITRPFVAEALRRYAVWDVGNAALYAFCRKHPEHRSVEAIVAKVWLIGRSYAASIERGRTNQSARGDDFYVDVVGPQVRSAGVDGWFAPLRGLRRPEADSVIPVHARLTELFARISGLEKRSLASKYLHFHVPRTTYIYDARADRAIRQVTQARHLRALPFDPCDETYARFFLRCRELHDGLEALMGRAMSPREVDKVLLAVAERG
jgi:hypothetical protein